MAIIENIVAVALLAAFLYFGIRYLKRRAAARISEPGAQLPRQPRDEQ
jgi:hypothetical protein